MGERNRAKAEKLYRAIDESDFYRNPVARASRSWMNVPFTLARPELDKSFVVAAGEAGVGKLEGHRLFWGMRARPFNPHPPRGGELLIRVMAEFVAPTGLIVKPI